MPDGGVRYIPVERLIEVHLKSFFPGLAVKKTVPFRVIRNADITLPEDEVQDLLKSVETELHRRERKEVVWLEIAKGADENIVDLLSTAAGVTEEDIFFTPDLPKLGDLMEIYHDVQNPSLKEPPFNPRIPSQLATTEDIFSIIRRGDVLLHRPYDSFTAVI